MYLPGLMVSRALHTLVLTMNPSLRRSRAYRLLFYEIAFPHTTDRVTGEPVLPWTRLAAIEGKVEEMRSKHYDGVQFLDGYIRTTGHAIRLRPHDARQRLARTVSDRAFPPALAAAIEEELVATPIDPVDIATSHPWTSATSRRLRLRQQRAAEANPPTHALARAFQAYLHAVPLQRFTRMVEEFGPRAMATARAEPEPIRRAQNLTGLRGIACQPKPFYKPSSRGRSCRLFPEHFGLGVLSHDVATAIMAACFELDLANAQLAICARLWDIPEVLDFLRNGGAIWPELIAYLGCGPAEKPAIKRLVYALLFGAAVTTIIDAFCQELPHESELTAADARRLMSHPLLIAVYDARARELARVRQMGGGWGCDGSWIAMPYDENDRGALRPNPRSVLAQQAQLVEQHLMEPLLVLARQTNEFYIIYWAHDGCCVDFVDSRRQDMWIGRLQAAVAERARELGVPTRLVVTRDPRMSPSA